MTKNFNRIKNIIIKYITQVTLICMIPIIAYIGIKHAIYPSMEWTYKLYNLLDNSKIPLNNTLDYKKDIVNISETLLEMQNQMYEIQKNINYKQTTIREYNTYKESIPYQILTKTSSAMIPIAGSTALGWAYNNATSEGFKGTAATLLTYIGYIIPGLGTQYRLDNLSDKVNKIITNMNEKNLFLINSQHNITESFKLNTQENMILIESLRKTMLDINVIIEEKIQNTTDLSRNVLESSNRIMEMNTDELRLLLRLQRDAIASLHYNINIFDLQQNNQPNVDEIQILNTQNFRDSILTRPIQPQSMINQDNDNNVNNNNENINNNNTQIFRVNIDKDHEQKVINNILLDKIEKKDNKSEYTKWFKSWIYSDIEDEMTDSNNTDVDHKKNYKYNDTMITDDTYKKKSINTFFNNNNNRDDEDDQKKNNNWFTKKSSHQIDSQDSDFKNKKYNLKEFYNSLNNYNNVNNNIENNNTTKQINNNNNIISRIYGNKKSILDIISLEEIKKNTTEDLTKIREESSINMKEIPNLNNIDQNNNRNIWTPSWTTVGILAGVGLIAIGWGIWTYYTPATSIPDNIEKNENINNTKIVERIEQYKKEITQEENNPTNNNSLYSDINNNKTFIIATIYFISKFLIKIIKK